MLCLNRKEGEKLVIAGNIMTINRIDGKRVTVGISAPPDVKVLRSEVEDEDKPDGRWK